MKFEDVFGDPKMVDSTVDRALAEAVADVIGAGTGMPGDWDPDFELEGETEDGDDVVEMAKTELVAAIAAASGMLLKLLPTPAQRRAAWRELVCDLVKSGPAWGQFAVVAYDMKFDELSEEVRQFQLEGAAKAKNLAPDDPVLLTQLEDYVFVGANTSTLEDGNPEQQLRTLQGVQDTVTRLTVGLASRIKSGLSKPGSGIVGPDGTELPSTQ